MVTTALIRNQMVGESRHAGSNPALSAMHVSPFWGKNRNKLTVFQNKNIRRTWHQEEWFYSVVDIIAVLTDSPTPRKYWGKIKDREFTKFQLSPIWGQLKLLSKDGKKYTTDCANTKGVFRLIQSIPSKVVTTVLIRNQMVCESRHTGSNPALSSIRLHSCQLSFSARFCHYLEYQRASFG